MRGPFQYPGGEMTMIGKTFAIAVTGCCLIGPALLPASAEAWADDAPPGAGEGRYAFNKVPDGFVRLDMQTGDVSLCSQHGVGWACQAVPEDRAVLENEIARLRSENAALKKDILARGLPLPSGAMPEPPSVSQGERLPQWHSNSDLDRVMAFVGQVWHRFVEAIARAGKQMQNRG
jgi:hypothetical protein